MKKIGIITIPDYNNYGNRLQNYAVKKYFEKIGFFVNTLEMNDANFPKRKVRKIKLSLKKWKLYFLVHLFELIDKKMNGLKRYLKFEKFSKRYLNIRYVPDWNLETCKQVGKEYDYIVLGSDQIWHPYVNKTPNLFFGLFVEPEKRIFLSPSFGVETITSEYGEMVKNNLINVKKLSVREEAGKLILDKLINSDVTILCDPTLLLSKEEWEVLASKPKHIPNKYILSYFLGPLNEVYKKEKEKIETILDCVSYEIASKDKKETYVTGPSEFIYSIKNSEFVITDSFHAVVFSIIFKKPFLVFSRLKDNGELAGLDSRIDSLLEKFKISFRKYNGKCNFNDLSSFDDNTDDILAELRQEVNAFIDSMNVK